MRKLTEVVVHEGQVAADEVARKGDDRDPLEEVDEADDLGPRPSDPHGALEEEVGRDAAIGVRVVLGKEGGVAWLGAQAAGEELDRDGDKERAEVARQSRQRQRVVP